VHSLPLVHVPIKFIGHSLEVPHRRHVCNFYHTKYVSYRIWQYTLVYFHTKNSIPITIGELNIDFVLPPCCLHSRDKMSLKMLCVLRRYFTTQYFRILHHVTLVSLPILQFHKAVGLCYWWQSDYKNRGGYSSMKFIPSFMKIHQMVQKLSVRTDEAKPSHENDNF